MPDHARSADAAVQAQLDRLWALSPGADVLGLDRITQLLARLGDPHRHLPPVFHVAGTNGKGSTCAFLRAALEAAGYRVHAYTSPHLVRFNERIRLGGALIDDPALASLLDEVLDVADGIGASFFEVTTAAAFLAFSRTPADACVVEVGLGGRLDATNVLPTAAACGIAALGMDHEAFLGNTLPLIAAEKAGIAKQGVPLVTMSYPGGIAAVIARVATASAAPLCAAGSDWHHAVDGEQLHYRDARGELSLPLPSLHGPHQGDNLALATAMLRHQHVLPITTEAMARGAGAANWPARLQRLSSGPLVDRLPPGTPVWLDGGHNASAGAALAQALPRVGVGRDATLIVGMLANKDPHGFLEPLAPFLERVIALPVPHHACHDPGDLAALATHLGVPFTDIASNAAQAFDMAALPSAPRAVSSVLVAGSLYLAGEILSGNDEVPQ